MPLAPLAAESTSWPLKEGFFLHDAKRLQAMTGNSEFYMAGTLPYNSPKLIFLMPLRETLANPKLQQNQG